MDGFTAALIALVLIAGGSFTAGRYMPLYDVKKDCSTKGEFVVQSTVIKCKPVAAWVDGKRIEFVEQ
ncbi:hypothetical protein D3C80_1299670 [compost metagenome]